MEIIRRFVQPLVPSVLIARIRHYSESNQERLKRAQFEDLRGIVSEKVAAIRSLTPEQCLDADYLENDFVPLLGLNDELLNDYPKELRSHYGSGLHLWQYPNQLAKFLVWMSGNVREIRCYMEIGCRWGGMFILVSEWLRKHSVYMQTAIAVDIISPTPLIDEYFKLLNANPGDQHKIEPVYIREFSTSKEFKRVVERLKPDFVFIDGDHTLRGALSDHMLVRDFARIIVHHDVHSDTCTDTTMLWNVLRQLERHEFTCCQFVDQYKSVGKNINGFGVMYRRTPTSFAQTQSGPSQAEEGSQNR
jgi:hypothetical protein